MFTRRHSGIQVWFFMDHKHIKLQYFFFSCWSNVVKCDDFLLLFLYDEFKKRKHRINNENSYIEP